MQSPAPHDMTERADSNRRSSVVNRQSLLTFTAGGWVILLAGTIGLGLTIWAVAPALMRTAQRPPGDGKNIDSYGFDLSNLQVPRDLVVPAMLHRDMVPVITNPSVSGPDPVDPNHPDQVTWRQMQRRNDPKYGKYLVPSDLVIGVEINGEARAYPIGVMYVHEIINDTLGGVPIAVTHHWPCDSIVVFDRRPGGRDEPVEFGVSGMVYNSNLLMYDKPQAGGTGILPAQNETTGGTPVPPGKMPAPPQGGAETQPSSSLWSQLLGRAVSGPATGKQLTIIPSVRTSWAQWSKLHPRTTVLDRNLRMAQRYKEAVPTAYLQSERLLFPIDPRPPAPTGGGSLPSIKTRVLAVAAGERRRVYPLPFILRNATAGTWTDTLGDTQLRFICDPATQTVRVEADRPVQAVHAYWFAWHAMHPEDELVGPSS